MSFALQVGRAAAQQTDCGSGFVNGNNSSVVAAEFGMATGGVLRKPICISQSNVTLDCGDKWIDGAGLSQENGITVTSSAQWVTIRHCKVRNFKTGVLIATNPGDLSWLAYGYWNGADVTPIEDGIRANQAGHIWIDNLETSGVVNGLYVLNYATDVNLSWSKISASGVGVYLDSGSQYNVIRDSTFSTSSSNREAIAVDASAYNQIVRNRFEGGWTAGVEVYKNCGEQWWAPPRPQPAMWNRIKYNTFVGLPVGVRIATRADKLFDNWKAGESAANSTGWKCADRIYNLPPNPGPGTSALDLTHLPYRGDSVYRQAYYRDRAPDNVVRCNSFTNTSSAITIKDDHALVEGNRRAYGTAIIGVGSSVRSAKSEPVANVNVMNNAGTSLSCPYGGCVTNRTNVNSEWGEPEGCNDCSSAKSTCPQGFTYTTPTNPPGGWIDSATRTQVCGWAVDLDHPADSIAVHVYVDGANGVAGTANLASPDVNAAVHVTGNHRFCIPVNIGPGIHQVVAYGIDPDGTGNPALAGSPKLVGPELVVGDVVPYDRYTYAVGAGNAIQFIGGGATLNACPAGYSFIGGQGSANGFWLCARNDVKTRTFYIGDVENNAGYNYRVEQGRATYLGNAGWDTCVENSTLLGTVFEVNGFWACMR